MGHLKIVAVAEQKSRSRSVSGGRKTLSVRTHECPKCGLTMDRDENAAINILHRAIEDIQAVGLIVRGCGRNLRPPFKSPVSACGGLDNNQPVKQETSNNWVQLSLF